MKIKLYMKMELYKKKGVILRATNTATLQEDLEYNRHWPMTPNLKNEIEDYKTLLYTKHHVSQSLPTLICGTLPTICALLTSSTAAPEQCIKIDLN
jgi:hypothetical protein